MEEAVDLSSDRLLMMMMSRKDNLVGENRLAGGHVKVVVKAMKASASSKAAWLIGRAR